MFSEKIVEQGVKGLRPIELNEMTGVRHDDRLAVRNRFRHPLGVRQAVRVKLAGHREDRATNLPEPAGKAGSAQFRGTGGVVARRRVPEKNTVVLRPLPGGHPARLATFALAQFIGGLQIAPRGVFHAFDEIAACAHGGRARFGADEDERRDDIGFFGGEGHRGAGAQALGDEGGLPNVQLLCKKGQIFGHILDGIGAEGAGRSAMASKLDGGDPVMVLKMRDEPPPDPDGVAKARQEDNGRAISHDFATEDDGIGNFRKGKLDVPGGAGGLPGDACHSACLFRRERLDELAEARRGGLEKLRPVFGGCNGGVARYAGGFGLPREVGRDVE